MEFFNTPHPALNLALERAYRHRGPLGDGSLRELSEAIDAVVALLDATHTAQAAPAAGAVAEQWRPMETAPKDGTLVRLLVEFEDGATEDGEGPHPTIGSNTWDNHHDFDEWQFAGWNWTHDCFTQGAGKPVGWLPMLAAVPTPAAQADSQPAPDVDLIARGMRWEECEALMKEACAQAGVQWEEEKEPQSIAINVMQRLANAAHKVGFTLGKERMAAARKQGGA